MTADDLQMFLAEERERVDAALDGLFDGVGDSPLVDAARYALESGGKRLRPILCVAGFGALRPDPSDRPVPLYRLAASLELIHTYSLIHDDLPAMDDDDVRRGRPATHVTHGAATATVAGAALIPFAVRAAHRAAGDLKLDDGVRRDLVGTLCRAAGAGGMVGGQALDLAAEGGSITLDALEAIHRRKTGALLGAAPLMGGIAAGARGGARDALAAYGAALGLAFQIADDILDVTGDAAVLGKAAGRDRQLEKATFPGLAGLDRARDRAEAEVARALSALESGGLRSRVLEALARFAVARDR